MHFKIEYICYSSKDEDEKAYSYYLVIDLNPSINVCYAAFIDATHKYPWFAIYT